MTVDSPAVVTNIDDAIAVIRFNRPAQRNSLSISTLHQLETILADLSLRDDVRCLIFTGSEDVFASGANIRELAQLDSTSAVQFSQLGQRVFQNIADSTKLTIAAINGYCMGGALDLALACDIRVASPAATFSHPGSKLGIITGWGGTQRLPRIIGRTRALELFATARKIGSEEALFIGLVATVAEPVMECSKAIARQLFQSSNPAASE
jgi:enoyl-CoA hydratase